LDDEAWLTKHSFELRKGCVGFGDVGFLKSAQAAVVVDVRFELQQLLLLLRQ